MELEEARGGKEGKREAVLEAVRGSGGGSGGHRRQENSGVDG